MLEVLAPVAPGAAETQGLEEFAFRKSSTQTEVKQRNGS